MSRPAGPRDRWLLAGAAVVALVATAGSLFLSEVWGLYPCDLCWYQRILMYPLVVVLGVAAYETRPRVYRTVLPLSGVGLAVSTYHSWLQATSDGSCGFGGGCAAIQYRLEPLGLTVPNLALVAFALVTAAGVVLWRRA
ncbi:MULTISPECIES: disulfide bond formation protein B [Salinibaculum]|uniref:disulfide bond formation protein B n=1 Tax=Salinibaculum TaxID=2732368 RepID=UPI0030D0BD59